MPQPKCVWTTPDGGSPNVLTKRPRFLARAFLAAHLPRRLPPLRESDGVEYRIHLLGQAFTLTKCSVCVAMTRGLANPEIASDGMSRRMMRGRYPLKLVTNTAFETLSTASTSTTSLWWPRGGPDFTGRFRQSHNFARRGSSAFTYRSPGASAKLARGAESANASRHFSCRAGRTEWGSAGTINDDGRRVVEPGIAPLRHRNCSRCARVSCISARAFC